MKPNQTEHHSVATLTARLGLPRTSVQRLLENETIHILERLGGGKILKVATAELEAVRADATADLAQRIVRLSTNPADNADARLIDAWHNASTPAERAGLWPEFGKRFQENICFRNLLEKTNGIKNRAYDENQKRIHSEIKSGQRSGMNWRVGK